MRCFQTAPLLLIFCLATYPTTVWGDSKTESVCRMLQAEELGQISPLHRSGQIYLAGQPGEDDFNLIQKAGVKTVINLRPSRELKWDEAMYLKMLNLDYVQIPFRAPESLTPAIFDQCRKLLNDKSKQPLVLHCASANRVGAIWLTHRVLDDGLSFEAALAEAKQVGLKTPGYIEQARAYIAQQGKAE
ncbi:protein tyrosine phosphatase family protein [Gimesia chilikensis]|uniref:DSP-PTPase phosphatase fused to NAD+ Kinase domain-containing protein n=1 Tax=Gimesia chilikensis TaxID=2605989 RepID=A0A517PV63_9PLAN|nr:protein tyrosine phosphatase family protein [Gimesia chilikensis]QDT23258.1 hypothetical protein HG66A1_50750 [Gimesia chilikensis]